MCKYLDSLKTVAHSTFPSSQTLLFFVEFVSKKALIVRTNDLSTLWSTVGLFKIDAPFSHVGMALNVCTISNLNILPTASSNISHRTFFSCRKCSQSQPSHAFASTISTKHVSDVQTSSALRCPKLRLLQIAIFLRVATIKTPSCFTLSTASVQFLDEQDDVPARQGRDVSRSHRVPGVELLVHVAQGFDASDHDLLARRARGEE